MSVAFEQLAPYRRLFEELVQRQVQFALFKGLDKVDAVLAGADGDIDILLETEAGVDVNEAFADAGFHRDLGATDRLGDTVTVYRAFDVESAHFVMVHAYTELLLGDRFELHYPYEADMMSTSIERNGYRVIGPDHEWVVRALNDLAKRRFDDPYVVDLAARVDDSSSVINEGLRRCAAVEFVDLLGMFERRDAEALDRLRQQIFVSRSANALVGSAPVSWFSRKARAGWGRTPLSRVRNKMGISRSVLIQGSDQALIKEIATQVATQLAPVARVKIIEASNEQRVSGGLGRLKVALHLWRGRWVVISNGPAAFPAHVQTTVGGGEGEGRPEAIASMIIDEGLRHGAAR